MKILIDDDGGLHLERAGLMMLQFCPFYSGERCGHWCPLFRIGSEIEPLRDDPESTVMVQLGCVQNSGVGNLYCKRKDYQDLR
jgi:hypothetical protein